MQSAEIKSKAPATNTEKQSTHRKDIDGLRGVAVVAVIINHLHESWLASGHLGVDVFFVISGYVITLSLMNRVNQGLGSFLADFYSRRVKRLMPALLVCVLLTSIPVVLLMLNPHDSLATGRMALVGLANIYLYNIGTNYLSESAQGNAFLQMWSLGVEEQFYFIFPLLFWMLMRWQGRSKLMGAAFFFSGLSLASLVLYLLRIRTDYWSAFFLLPTRFWELGLGVVSFLLLRVLSLDKRSLHWPRWSVNVVAPCLQSLFLIGLIATLFRNQAEATSSTLLVALLTALLIAVGSVSPSLKTPLAHPWLLWLGMISYSLYLWHWSVLYTARMLKVVINPGTAVALTLVMVLLAMASYHWIEHPLRLAKWGGSSRQIISKGVLGIFSGIAILSLAQELLLARYPIQQKVLFRSTTWLGKSKDNCHLQRVDQNSINTHIKECLPKVPNQPSAIVIGNSHALQYVPMIKAALPGWNVTRMTMWGCGYLPKTQFSPDDINLKGCDVYGEHIKEHLSQTLRKNDIVFLGYMVFDGLATPMLKRHVAELAKVVSARGAHLVVLDDVYSAPYAPEDCEPTIPMILGRVAKRSSCNFPVASARNANALTAFEGLMKGLGQKDGVVYIATRDWVCPDGVCTYRQPNGSVTFDYGSHLFQDTSAALGPMLRKELRARNLLPAG